MADQLPLLVFPSARSVPPPVGNGFLPSRPHFPEHGKQSERLAAQFSALQQSFDHYKASISGAVAGLEPEAVLVIEIAGRVDDFRQAVEAAGLEWLGEWDLDDIEPDEDFYELNSKNERTDKKVTGRLFLSLVNEKGLNEILSLWGKWQNRLELPFGMAKWRDVFSQIVLIRRWGIEETLGETGMLELWRGLIDTINPDQAIYFQIELFYKNQPAKRLQNQNVIEALLHDFNGQIVSSFIDMPDIGFHAVKAKLPASKISLLLDEINNPHKEIDIHLFKFPGIMYFRPTGQSLAAMQDAEGEVADFPKGKPDLPPVAAIFDGVPNLLHEALKDRLIVDDPENLAEFYQPGERRHGTSIASLVVHGELDDKTASPLARQIYHRPIMQPDPASRNRDEHVPEEIFLEDRIWIAVRRMMEGEADAPAQAPGVKIVNLSIGDRFRPFIHTPSPLARLLDWLAWKYRILFCVSAGNFVGDIDLQIPVDDFSKFSNEEKITHTLKCIEQQLSERRLISPAEAMNALTVGALHDDRSGDYPLNRRIDLLPSIHLFSPVSRFGHGFRKSIKPEILFPGGRQLYQTPVKIADSKFRIDGSMQLPGQRVAWDSKQPGELSECVHTRGTSNANALATRSGVLIYDVLQTLQIEHQAQIRDDLMAVLIKTLLVHGAIHHEQTKAWITAALRTEENSRKIREVLARYIGYGAVDVDRVLRCTEQRGTVLGCGEIKANEVHEYRLPLPPSLANREDWRRLVVTLAWFTPINPSHRNLREAKLAFSPAENWDKIPLKLARRDADHHQVQRGTVQHEVLEGEKKISAYQDGQDVLIHVTCKADATNSLDELIPYGLAVTLEVKEGIGLPIYQELRARIRPKVVVGA